MEEAFHFNVATAHALCRAAVPLMLESGGGTVVNISSIMGRVSGRGYLAYGAAKAALAHYTRLAARDLAPRIRVNAIAVGSVATSALEFVVQNDEIRTAMEDATPLQQHRRSRRCRRRGHLPRVARFGIRDGQGAGGRWRARSAQPRPRSAGPLARHRRHRDSEGGATGLDVAVPSSLPDAARYLRYGLSYRDVVEELLAERESRSITSPSTAGCSASHHSSRV